MNNLHEQQIIHRDIKLENILINSFKQSGPVIKLTDFGFAKKCQKEERLTDRCGSRYYMAPEVNNKFRYDLKADVWSACVVIYILLQGNMPFYGQDLQQVLDDIKSRDVPYEMENESSWSHISKEAKDFIKRGL